MFEDRLKRLREARGLSQKEVAEALGIPTTTYNGYENNKREPSSTTLIKLSRYFGVTLDYLLDYHCENKKNPSPALSQREILKSMLDTVDDDTLIEIRNYLKYLVWLESHQEDEQG